MVCKCTLRRLQYAFFIFVIILVCLHFLTSVTRLPEIIQSRPTDKAQSERKAKFNKTKTKVDSSKGYSTIQDNVLHNLLWFFKNGTTFPRSDKGIRRGRKIWPEEAPDSDRITQQLMYVPEGYNVRVDKPLKRILLWHGLDNWIKPGQRSFTDGKCPINQCSVTDDHSQASIADAILFKDHFTLPQFRRPLNQVEARLEREQKEMNLRELENVEDVFATEEQLDLRIRGGDNEPKIWIIYLLECPYHTERFQYNDLINWTATYRRDSDIVTPYEKWVYYDEAVKQRPPPSTSTSTTIRTEYDRNYAANKTRLVAWFVSNCNARNGRLRYARELQKHITVDIYGFCGPLKCPRTQECFHLLETEYKFYLAFENSNCVDYITEKFFVNGLQHNILPVVMGARPEDYEAVAPYHSYIHVDNFSSAKELAQYLHKLNDDDNLYNSYFRWKGTGEFINTHFFCRLCAMLHDTYPTKSYRNLNKWWKNVGTCINSGWRRTKKQL